MKTFSITTLGCRVNHYESEQLAAWLVGRGLIPAPPGRADLRIVHTCSVTSAAAGKSRQQTRKMTRLPILGEADPITLDTQTASSNSVEPRPRVVVTGCWATSNTEEARRIHGVDAVLTHHGNVARELERLLEQWEETKPTAHKRLTDPESDQNDVWMKKAGTPAGFFAQQIKPRASELVKGKLEDDEDSCDESHKKGSGFRVQGSGMNSLPLLDARQSSHQRAFLKIQDGCDAHCTYCIIPQLRPTLFSKPVHDAVEEAKRLVAAGHREIVLTGIFMGAYGQPTALRRRQSSPTQPLIALIDALCTRVPKLARLRLSSLEPGDMTPDLLSCLKSHPQIVPHFHLPLQSGSETLLRRMNRQYSRDDFLRLADMLQSAYDRPAITTDIIVGFPGETDAEFAHTVSVVERVRFIHIHAFSFSPRQNTAAARWTRDFVPGHIVNQRIAHLRELAANHSLMFRESFVGQTVEVLVEKPSADEQEMRPLARHLHGRCERYFAVHFQKCGSLQAGDRVRLCVSDVTAAHTFGTPA